jgi:tetratricopeptide (TPR) repeat protein
MKLDKVSIDQQMMVEKHQRKTIKHARQAQHDEAQDMIFKDIDDINKLDSELTKGGVNASKKVKEFEVKKNNAAATVDQAQMDMVGLENNKNYKKTIKEDIFGDEDVVGGPSVTKYSAADPIGQCTVEEIEDEEEEAVEEQEEEEPVIEEAETPAPPELPQVRQKKDVELPFTEKKFAHLPARESHFKEAPYPKSKKVDKDPSDVYIDVEDKDPLWLKDKGDHFYKRHDFHSAINAYTKSIKNDKDFLMARINRGTTFMAMRAFTAAVDDFTDIETMINALSDKEREEDNDYYVKMMGRMHLKRAAANAWISQFDASIKDFKDAMKFKSLYNESEIMSMEKDIVAIEKRKES